MAGRLLFRWFSAAWLVLFVSGMAMAAPWVPSGPNGGDARQIVSDPHDQQHLYLGTTDGWLFQSHTMGASWQRVARVGDRDDLVIDSIVIDPRDASHLVIGAWVIGTPAGGIFISHDSGVTWTSQEQMRGQSVRALAASRSNPDILVAGTLEGVFRSTDDGQHWTQISPKDSKEIHEVESVAIDPVNPETIYVGTWHLPWKTTDAGKTWANIKQGIIDDSDVFSIIVDPAKPETVYASACSGIYKSLNAGDLFKKVQGIPSTARRTRILLQDPNQPDTVFAGTTEGLWRSIDGGDRWTRTTGPELIVNDVWIAPSDSKRVLISTDRGGVLASEDGGDTFKPSNAGFSARQVTSLLRDRKHSDQFFVGVVNDKKWGGVFESSDGSASWTQRADGLEGRDVFSLGQAEDGTIVAGTSHGLYLLNLSSERWTRMEIPLRIVTVALPAGSKSADATTRKSARKVSEKSRRTSSAHPTKLQPAGNKPTSRKAELHGKKAVAPTKSLRKRPLLRHKLAVPSPGGKTPNIAVTQGGPGFDGAVYAITSAGSTLIASTSIGVLASTDNGHTWSLEVPVGSADWRYLAGSGRNVVAASGSAVFLSADAGANWKPVGLPEGMKRISAVALDAAGEVWVGGNAGVFVSSDGGSVWMRPKNLYVSSVADVFYDDYYNRVYVTTHASDSMVFTMQLPERLVLHTQAGWDLRLARQAAGHLVGSTRFDGVVVEPSNQPITQDPIKSVRPAPLAGSPDSAAAKPHQD